MQAYVKVPPLNNKTSTISIDGMVSIIHPAQVTTVLTGENSFHFSHNLASELHFWHLI